MWKTWLLIVVFLAGVGVIAMASYVGVAFGCYEWTGTVLSRSGGPYHWVSYLYVFLFFVLLFSYLHGVGRLLGRNIGLFAFRDRKEAAASEDYMLLMFPGLLFGLEVGVLTTDMIRMLGVPRGEQLEILVAMMISLSFPLAGPGVRAIYRRGRNSSSQVSLD